MYSQSLQIEKELAMTGAAIASAGMSVYSGMQASDRADDAQRSSEEESMLARQDREAAMGVIEGNQSNVDALQSFLNDMGAQGIEYAQGLLDNWEQSFGGVQDNLTEYYENLDPTKYAVEQKALFKESIDKQMTQYNETMAAGGLQSAGMKAQTAKEAAFKTAQTNAQIDIGAEDKVASMKQDWLQFGDAQRASGENAMNTALGREAEFGTKGFQAQTDQNTRLAGAMVGDAQAHDQYAANYGASAAGYEEASGNYFGNAISSGITAYDSWNSNPNPINASIPNIPLPAENLW